MNSQFINESVEIARNCASASRYLYGEHTNQLANCDTFNFNMCSSMISKVEPVKVEKKTFKKTILGKLKQKFRKATKQSNEPTLQKFVYKSSFSADSIQPEESIIAQHISTVKCNNIIQRQASYDDLSACYSNDSDEEVFETMPMPETSDFLPSSEIFLFNNSDEISYLFDNITYETEQPTEVIQYAPSASTAVELSTNILIVASENQDGQTSTPILKRKGIQQEEDTFVCYEADTTMDESTQALVDEPVLLEETFNTSSCSNLSGDLIVIQTGFSPKTSANNTSSYHSANSTDANTILIDRVPDWAMGQQLNLAIVNQVYFAKENQNNLFEWKLNPLSCLAFFSLVISVYTDDNFV